MVCEKKHNVQCSLSLSPQEYEQLEVCPKVLFQLELSRGEKDRDFGLVVEAELAEDTDQEDELCVFISDVTKGGVAHKKGRSCYKASQAQMILDTAKPVSKTPPPHWHGLSRQVAFDDTFICTEM